MNWSLLNIATNFNNLRYSVGIAMMFNGFPLIFFIRDTLGIGPASSVFTAIFFSLALTMMVPMHLFKRLYKPNVILFNLGLGFLLLTLYYFFFINKQGKAVADIGNYVFIFGFLVLLLHVPNDVKETLVMILFLMSLFTNITLVYSILTDPNWTPGMRAAVNFANEGAQPGGNPHITARNGIICMLTGMVMLNRTPGIITKLFLFFSVLFGLGVIVISLAKSSYLAVGLMIGAYFVLHFKISNVFTAIGSAFKLRNMAFIILILIGLRYFLIRYGNILDMLLGYWDMFQNRIMDVIFTSTGVRITDTADTDASAMGRVGGFAEFTETFFSWDVFLGRGFKSDYLDIPLLESWVSHGIFGFVFFAGFNFFLFIYAMREIKRYTNPLTTFLAYFFLSLMVLLFTGGRPFDIAFWFPYLVMIRFLGIKYLDSISRRPVAAQLTTVTS
ncbi:MULTISPECIES: hypothetical protein [Dyadobacter]|uniref:Uncharacterized protein n=1 Tax=Dyadobacter chenhuakuii TaxID=2909339 RepID=A0A9X1U2Q8_9BACT|nr:MULTISPECIES: hypothetical protein [Dyadobacter]MCE7071426.1 hypothetical protein [Dyadobacter sp. CY327]MCF2493687.1 hypothetical protein [Dyadobacter chenhuakuii]MCF2500801.1 hypothetical protein [Dyadobacter chenhuakuii]USJ30822.1 hypothetical protein NFI80_23560 [Dyadobacter chenhuakuii]